MRQADISGETKRRHVRDRSRSGRSRAVYSIGIAVIVVACTALGPVSSSASAAASGSLAGVVHYPDKAVAAGVIVSIMPAQPVSGTSYPVREAVTDPAGEWSYAELPAGEYRLVFIVVSASGDRQTEANPVVTVAEGQTQSLETTLSGPEGPGVGTLNAIVTTSAGLAPGGNTEVQLRSTDALTPMPVAVNADGSLLVQVPAGTYTASVTRGPTEEIDSSEAESLETQTTVSAGTVTSATYQLTAAPPLPVPAGTSATESERDLTYLNAERARWGLPSALALNDTWSEACAAHDGYLADNDRLEHPEDSSLPGASPGGAWAGLHSILSEGTLWTAEANPWEDAPIHLDQLYTPDLALVGIDESRGHSCVTTWPGITSPLSPLGTVITYPGNETSGIPPAEDAAEEPFVPGDFIGLPEGTIAGRELFVYEEQEGLGGCGGFCFARAPELNAASLSGPSGPVEVRWLGGESQIGGYLTGAIVVPVHPLEANSRYTATVTIAGNPLYGTAEETHTWSFTTGAANPTGAWPGTSYGAPQTEPQGSQKRRASIVHLRLSPKAFRDGASRAGHHARRPGVMQITYTDSADALTTITIWRLETGACRVRAYEHHKSRTCTRLVRAFSFTRGDRVGLNHLAFSGKHSGMWLSPGKYRLEVVARLSGDEGSTAAAAFSILP